MIHPFEIKDQLLVSKTGCPEDCEDALYIGDDFVAVIDGATSKFPGRWEEESRGRFAARILKETFPNLPSDASAPEIVAILTDAIHKVYVQFEVEELMRQRHAERLTASVAILSLTAREVWMVGDCQALIGGRWIRPEKEIDSLLAAARAAVLQIELAEGKSIEELKVADPGREFIRPLLERQSVLQNNHDGGTLQYSVIDGFDIPPKGIRVFEIPKNVESVVLATDGYPVLCPTLQETEAELEKILESDPLLIRQFRTTKTKKAGHVSFDDRAFVRLTAR